MAIRRTGSSGRLSSATSAVSIPQALRPKGARRVTIYSLLYLAGGLVFFSSQNLNQAVRPEAAEAAETTEVGEMAPPTAEEIHANRALSSFSPIVQRLGRLDGQGENRIYLSDLERLLRHADRLFPEDRDTIATMTVQATEAIRRSEARYRFEANTRNTLSGLCGLVRRPNKVRYSDVLSTYTDAIYHELPYQTALTEAHQAMRSPHH